MPEKHAEGETMSNNSKSGAQAFAWNSAGGFLERNAAGAAGVTVSSV
jgi:hypothetical protein